MSRDGSCSQTQSRAIPATRWVVLGKGMQLQHNPPAAHSSAPPREVPGSSTTRNSWSAGTHPRPKYPREICPPFLGSPALPVMSSQRKPARATCAIAQKISGLSGRAMKNRYLRWTFKGPAIRSRIAYGPHRAFLGRITPPRPYESYHTGQAWDMGSATPAFSPSLRAPAPSSL